MIVEKNQIVLFVIKLYLIANLQFVLNAIKPIKKTIVIITMELIITNFNFKNLMNSKILL
jgi:hypothetical protein